MTKKSLFAASGVFIFWISISPFSMADVGKESFKKSFKEKGATRLCAENKDKFLKCFSLKQPQCEQSMSSTITKCVNELDAKMPKLIKASDGGKYGSMIGQCSLKKFYEMNKSKASKTKTCVDFVNEVKNP